MTNDQRTIPFQVDIAGVIDIMGTSLYSRADTPIRELLQNAHDAITRRKQAELDFQGRIDVQQNKDTGTITFSDNGIGLTPDEAEKYLGTLGMGITGLIKRGENEGPIQDQGDLIGQFGVGLFSAFMLADKLIVESRRDEETEPVRWEAGANTDVSISIGTQTDAGTKVTLCLKKEHLDFATDESVLERAIKDYADFLPVPIHLNGNAQRVNVINVAWFEPSQDYESTELALQSYFDETPLDVIHLRTEQPVAIAGALYVTPQRVPGFSDNSTVMVTIRRMVISRHVRGLLPEWATFLRGCLELHDCAPTASREDLVRGTAFTLVQATLEKLLYEHFEEMATNDASRLESIVNWHRYTFAGAALGNPRLRAILRGVYRLPTSHGPLTIDEILERSDADPLFEEEAEKVVWYNSDRRQERWVNSLFHDHSAPCIHAFRAFEESLIAECINDDNANGGAIDLRIASPSAPNFANAILGVRDLEEIEGEWKEFFSHADAKVLLGSFSSKQPVMAFLNERYQLAKSFTDLKERGEIPSGFQRLIDNHFEDAPATENEVILNRNHAMISRALSQKPGTPLSSVVRLLVNNALNSAGAALPTEAHRQQQDDLDWIAECLWGQQSD